ncbi:MAG: DUF106 domain-containing protein [Candidatus Methanomethylophilaceae archaeon]
MSEAPVSTPNSPRLTTILVFMFALFIMFDQNTRTFLGEVVGYVLMPVIGFNGEYPLLTLVLAGLLMVTFSIIVRTFFTDNVEMARNQKVMAAFNQELRQARIENNLYKIKKLTEHQQEVMSKSMEMSTQQLKLMPATMIFIIPIFAWISVFVTGLAAPVVAVPWSFNVQLNDSTVLPHWVLLYTLISIPFSQALSRTFRYIQFRKKLKQMEEGPEALA